MKNIINYLDEFIEDNLDECVSKKIKQDINKKNKKSHKKYLYEDDRQNNDISYNKNFKNSQKNKYKK